ncbi:4-hydroxy-tetrahydrodipicolinate synthase [Thermomicrobium roseum]|uniref:4-hydroxy-tetrahydrodipicolinate synthase n=1 Tax=Thermomicrobium roseum (strain ATCC 27502 / DSM 5159 / P-2) TaxID=309801 RepID=DAPA_THERP|nr:4-hydroxy-tetrahydrodipicolinate synthase [Thermomicrobium roseum]B9KY71.1 RecName: Full=4-hydroxy-tetrahydrodipicolinate synthase; Short=HTPA synthase [Thermomicrobium roseum DSM 5159]ACM05517.1 dihydrodipicolinate synthase [Thermomicrobium roseum DSM 5159]
MLRGTFVALITPFAGEEIDEPRLRDLVDWLIANRVDGLVPCGTTGETPSLSDTEWQRVAAVVIEQAAGRVPVIVGTGTNSTMVTIQRTRVARELGATAAMVVTPYYNKPQQDGLYRHVAAIADAVDLPLVIYNVPSRTGVNLAPETARRLLDIAPVIAFKDSSGSLDQVSELVLAVGDRSSVLSGDDSLTLPIIAVGGQGVVSVLANIAPAATATMVRAALDGDLARARQLHGELFPLARALFIETNPVPVKTAAELLGLCSATVRLPLAPLAPANRERLLAALASCPHTASLLARPMGEAA